MFYFINTFQVIKDGNAFEIGTKGTMSMTNGHQPNLIKNTVIKQFRENFPDAKNIAVVVRSSENVSKERYEEASKDFI